MIEQVLYPGLPSFAGHAAAAKQMKGGFGGMLSVRVKGGESARPSPRRRGSACGSAPRRWAASRA